MAEAVGAPSTLSAYAIRGNGMSVVDSAHLEASDVPAAFGAAEFTIASWQGTTQVGSVVVRPFECAQNPQTLHQMLSKGFRATETQQIFVATDGTLEVGTTFEHLLTYVCDVGGGGGAGIAGWGAYAASPPLCSAPDRNATSVRFSGTLQGQAFDGSPEICDAVLSEADTPTSLLYVFAMTQATWTLTAEVKLMQIDPSAAMPQTIQLPDAMVEAQLTMAGAASVSTEKTTSGTWTIEAVSFQDGGRTTAELNVLFGEAPDALLVAGQVSLPLLDQPSQ